eukprot:scaffold2272_cov203-Alexandrium_tamarense.AAC.15
MLYVVVIVLNHPRSLHKRCCTKYRRFPEISRRSSIVTECFCSRTTNLNLSRACVLQQQHHKRWTYAAEE